MLILGDEEVVALASRLVIREPVIGSGLETEIKILKLIFTLF